MRIIEIDVSGKGKAETDFDIPLEIEDENTSLQSAKGEICYWSQGLLFASSLAKLSPILK